MRILVLGGWGYLGWPTAMHLSINGHKVGIVDNYHKQRIEDHVGVSPLRVPGSMFQRAKSWKRWAGQEIDVFYEDVTSPGFVDRVVKKFDPEAIIHYAENPSAPYSMVDFNHAANTQVNNIVGTLRVLFSIKEVNPDIHLVKLGTMGEYGTPGVEIGEGWLDVDDGKGYVRLPFPKLPGSFYHASKVADSTNIEMVTRIWGLRATDLNQGVVYGVRTDETAVREDELFTSFHYDGVFGTALNRFIAQAVSNVPLTVYGLGGQTRGWLNIEDTLQCVRLAVENPPEKGEFRVFNQFTEVFSVEDLARRVGELTDTPVAHVPNPRVEAEHHDYRVVHTGLKDLGLKPKLLTDDVLVEMYQYVLKYKDNIKPAELQPKVQWNGTQDSD